VLILIFSPSLMKRGTWTLSPVSMVADFWTLLVESKGFKDLGFSKVWNPQIPNQNKSAQRYDHLKNIWNSGTQEQRDSCFPEFQIDLPPLCLFILIPYNQSKIR